MILSLRSRVYYNENDPKAVAWLRELMAQKLIPHGHIDSRSITEVRGHDLAGFRQCHFFAGIGGWARALQLANWPESRPVWTASCPCQPFSAAGKRKGEKDARHLWPWLRHLMWERRPAVAFGEQVASKAGRRWLAGVQANLETLGYEVGAADLCAAGVGSPHIRQRLYWLSYAESYGREQWRSKSDRRRLGGGSDIGGLADVRGAGLAGRTIQSAREECAPAERNRATGVSRRMGDAHRSRRDSRENAASSARHRNPPEPASDWSNFDTLPFDDGKTRRVEAGTFPLAHGVPGRVGLLRGYGNAIVPRLAVEFVGAFLDLRNPGA